MQNFIPMGWEDGAVPLTIIHKQLIEDREIVVCEYGFMIGCFDFQTGGKMCDLNTTLYPGHTNKEYIYEVINRSLEIAIKNPNWKDVLSKLPIINNNEL